MSGNWKQTIPESMRVRSLEMYSGNNGSNKDYDVVVVLKEEKHKNGGVAKVYSVECFSGPARQANNAQAKKPFGSLQQANLEVEKIRRAKEKKGYQVVSDNHNHPQQQPDPSPVASPKPPKKKQGLKPLNEMFKGAKPGVWF